MSKITDHHRSNGQSQRELIPDNGLFVGVIQGHEELGVLSDTTDKVPDKDVDAVGGGRLNPC